MSENVELRLWVPNAVHPKLGNLRDLGNNMAAALGYEHGPPKTYNTFCIPISNDGGTTLTHYMARYGASQAHLKLLQDGDAGTYPDIEGVTDEQFAAFMSLLNWDYSETIGDMDEFKAWLADNNLQLFQTPGP